MGVLLEKKMDKAKSPRLLKGGGPFCVQILLVS